MEVKQRALVAPKAEHFSGQYLADIFESIGGWLRSNPHISVLSIALETRDRSEEAVVFYE